MINFINRYEPYILGLFFLSLLVSKSAIYISLTLLLILQLMLLNNNKKAIDYINSNHLFIISISTFLLGIITTFPYNLNFVDLGEFIRKSILLLLFPLLTIQLKNSRNLHFAQVSLFTGLYIAVGYSIYNIIVLGGWSGERIASFWDVGRWSEVLGYILAMTVPFYLENEKTKTQNIILLFTILISIVCLLVSGGRGPLLAIIITLTIYLLIRNPKLLIAIATTIIFVAFIGQDVPAIHSITERVFSIFGLNTLPSNSARLAMWEQGFNFTVHNLINNPTSFLFGVGINNFEESYTYYIESIGIKQQLIELTENNYSFTDMHNTYLDLAIKLGFIYLLSYISLLVSLFLHFLKKAKTNPNIAYSAMALILTYIITGMFYTSGLEFQTSIFFSLVALCYARITNDEYYYEK